MALRSDATEALLAEMQAILHLAAEPRRYTDSAKAAIGRAAVALGLNYRRATSLWYRSDKLRVTPEEAARLRAERDRLLALRIARLERELAELRAQVRREDAQAAEEGARLAWGKGDCAGQASLIVWDNL